MGQSVLVNLQPHLQHRASSLMTPHISIPSARFGLTLLARWCFCCANNLIIWQRWKASLRSFTDGSLAANSVHEIPSYWIDLLHLRPLASSGLKKKWCKTSQHLCLPWVFHSGRSVLSPGGPCAVRPICTASRSADRLWRSTCWPSLPRARGTAALWGVSPAWARSGGVRWTASCLGEWPWGTPRSTTPRRSRTFLPRPEEGPARRTGTGPVRVAYLGWTWRR